MSKTFKIKQSPMRQRVRVGLLYLSFHPFRSAKTPRPAIYPCLAVSSVGWGWLAAASQALGRTTRAEAQTLSSQMPRIAVLL
ncbi:MAG: hypothetical protein N3D16_00185 [Anaerolineales bacterium]|nr:hypothetical protein [Anaerolineales bacterium]